MTDYIPLLEKIRQDIDKAAVVSFDIFDTLLLRPYVTPEDLFYHMERLENMPYFAMARIEAVKIARKFHPDLEEIPLDCIYDNIGEEFRPMRDKEIELERRVLQTNPEMAAVWQYAKDSGKKIVVVSDMYLPESIIDELLQKSGFGGYDELFLSSAVNKLKATGNLYVHILNKLSVKASDVLHIGDNKQSDYKEAKKHGLRAVLYKQVMRQFLEADKRAGRFLKAASSDWEGGIMISLLAWRWQKKQLGLMEPGDYWTNLGYEYAGPAIYGYMRWLCKTAKEKGIDRLLFVARDGYTLQKVFDAFDSKIQTSYIYAPRLLNLICRLDYSSCNSTFDNCNLSKMQADAIIGYYKKYSPEITAIVNETDFDKINSCDFIAKHKEIFENLAKDNFENYKNYLRKNICDSNYIGIVDTSSYYASAQRLIHDALKMPIHGFYWAISLRDAKCSWIKQNYSEFAGYLIDKNGNNYGITKKWDFMEFLLTSPEYPIVNIRMDGSPVYDSHPSEHERFQRSIYPAIANGALQFARDIKDIFGDMQVYLSANTLVRWIDIFIDHPKAVDRKIMSGVKMSSNIMHSESIFLFRANLSASYIMRHPFKAIMQAKRYTWRTLPETLVICLLEPLRVKTRGIKRVEIYLFPGLARRYFTVSLTPGEFYRYIFAVGRINA
ncbi:MAG: HAD-IA family hydrolase [Acidaminococcales bacterium]|jgi:HAD superfamily hydrolase (TIGR01549 family)|nr:HAD-IA family hydrolase [Acidaminococcales bacterium]